jgi:transposase
LVESAKLRSTLTNQERDQHGKDSKNLHAGILKRKLSDWREPCGKPIAQVGRSLGISDTSIHQWRRELAEHGKEAFPGSGHQMVLEEENRRLKREIYYNRQRRHSTLGYVSPLCSEPMEKQRDERNV